jgi:hypothetical protein
MKSQFLIKTEKQRQNIIKVFEHIEIPECGISVSWQDEDSKRTAQQNRMLWISAYSPIAEWMTYQSGNIITREMVHCICKDRYLDPIVIKYKGKEKSYVGSTTQLGKKAFGIYLEKVWEFGCAMGVTFES